MRTLLLLVILSSLSCTVQPSGARCEQDLDCNSDSDRCRSEADPSSACQGAARCICCPTSAAAAATVIGCVATRAPTDASTAADAAAD